MLVCGLCDRSWFGGQKWRNAENFPLVGVRDLSWCYPFTKIEKPIPFARVGFLLDVYFFLPSKVAKYSSTSR